MRERVWMVIRYDHEDSSVVGVYDSHKEAQKHADAAQAKSKGYGYIVEDAEVFSTYVDLEVPKPYPDYDPECYFCVTTPVGHR